VEIHLIDRVRQALDEAGYPGARLVEPGYLLDETETGQVRLRWGYQPGEVHPEPNDWVMICADFLITEGFDVQPGDWVVGEGGAILIRK
jgi:hypothetical protein